MLIKSSKKLYKVVIGEKGDFSRELGYFNLQKLLLHTSKFFDIFNRKEEKNPHQLKLAAFPYKSNLLKNWQTKNRLGDFHLSFTNMSDFNYFF